MVKRLTAILGVAAILGGGATVALAQGSSTPTAANGKPVSLFASGVNVPTSFAFGDGAVFEGDNGSETTGTGGGVFLLKGGKPLPIKGSPQVVFGLAWHRGKLYGSGLVVGKKGPRWVLFSWSGWNGTSFAHQKVIYTAPKGFPGFNGIAFGPDGRLYVGVDVGEKNDHGPARAPYQYDILSFAANGTGLQVYATGIRQPWQMVFAPGSSEPLVTDFGQDKAAKNPPDFLLKVRKGDDYGFPQCNWTNKKRCKGFTKPYKMFAPHTDNGGIGIIGKTLYMTQFGFTAPLHDPQVVSMPLKGGKVKPVVTGFPGPIVGLGVHAGWIYIGELGGTVNGTTVPGVVWRVHS